MINKKKAGIELSLNLIIMLIIGLIVLGLVVTYVTKYLGEAKIPIPSSDQGYVDKLKASSQIFGVEPMQVELVPGEVKNIYVKVYNSGDSNYKLEKLEGQIKDKVLPDLGLGVSAEPVVLDDNCNVEVKTPSVSVGVKESEVLPVALIIDKNCNIGGSFFVTVQFSQTGENLETETILAKIVSG